MIPPKPRIPTQAEIDAAQEIVNEMILTRDYGELQSLGAASMRPVWPAIMKVARRLVVPVSDGEPAGVDVQRVGLILTRVLTCATSNVVGRMGSMNAVTFRWLADTPMATILTIPQALAADFVDALADALANNLVSKDSDWFWRMVAPDDADTLRRIGVWPSARPLPRWPEYLWRAVFVHTDASEATASAIRDAIVRHVTADTGYLPDDPRCEEHPFVATILGTTHLAHDSAAALLPVLRSPAWVAVHGVELPA